MTNNITFEEYNKVEIKAGLIKEAARIKKSNKLIKMAVYFGGDDIRQIVTNIGEQYEPEQLIGITTSFVTNLEPVTIMKEESKGMLFATTTEDGSVVLLNLGEIFPGGKVIALGTKIG